MSTPNTQILVFSTILQPKVPGLLGEIADSKAGAGNMEDEPGGSRNARQEGSAKHKNKDG